MKQLTKINLLNIQAAHSTQYQKNKQPNKKVGKRSRHFSKEGIQMDNKHMKRCSTSLSIRERQIKTTIRYYLTPVRLAIIKKYKQEMLERVWRKESLLHCWWECKLV